MREFEGLARENSLKKNKNQKVTGTAELLSQTTQPPPVTHHLLPTLRLGVFVVPLLFFFLLLVGSGLQAKLQEDTNHIL